MCIRDRRYYVRGEVDPDVSPEPLHAARVVRSGTDATLLAYGPTLQTCLDAAEAAASEGRQLEVVDLRSLAPLDDDAIVASVERTGRSIGVHEASRPGGLGAEIAARVTESVSYTHLDVYKRQGASWGCSRPSATPRPPLATVGRSCRDARSSAKATPSFPS